jgi:hypothetical protein
MHVTWKPRTLLPRSLEESGVTEPGVPERIAAVIHRALDRDPAARFPDAAAFRAALLQVA